MAIKSLSSAIALCLAGAASAQLLHSGNILVNPGFDVGPPSAGGGVTAVPGWVGNAGVAFYGADTWWEIPAGEWSSGTQFFHGGSVLQTSIRQVYTLTAGDISGIAGGNAAFTASGWFGGWAGQNDAARLTVNFRDADGAALGTAPVLGGFNAAARNNVSSMLFASHTGLIDPLTRSIEFVLVADRVGGGTSNDGVADTLSFTAVPEPATMTALGLGAALLLRKRRRAA